MIVEVAYALAEKQSLISLEVKEGSTLKAVSYTHLTLPTNREV